VTIGHMQEAENQRLQIHIFPQSWGNYIEGEIMSFSFSFQLLSPVCRTESQETKKMGRTARRFLPLSLLRRETLYRDWVWSAFAKRQGGLEEVWQFPGSYSPALIGYVKKKAKERSVKESRLPPGGPGPYRRRTLGFNWRARGQGGRGNRAEQARARRK